jgi:hypothetical protein
MRLTEGVAQQLTWEDIAEHEPELREVLIPSMNGIVTLRELDAGEMLACHSAAMSGDPEDGLELDTQKLMFIQVAASLENPNLGLTVEDRIMQWEKVKSLPTRAFSLLSREVQSLSNINMERVVTLSKIIDSVPFLYAAFRVLAEKRGWLKDLDDVSVRELESWLAFYGTNDAKFRETMTRMLGQVQPQ